MEWTLQQQGFDFCYDKRLYDRLVSGSAAERPRAPERRRGLPGQAAAVHREPRRAAGGVGLRAGAGARGGGGRHDAARARGWSTTASSTGCGRGSRSSSPAGPSEPADADLRAFYERLLPAVAGPREGLGAVRRDRLARQRLVGAARGVLLARPPGRREPVRRGRRRGASGCPGRGSRGGPGRSPTRSPARSSSAPATSSPARGCTSSSRGSRRTSWCWHDQRSAGTPNTRSAYE